MYMRKIGAFCPFGILPQFYSIYWLHFLRFSLENVVRAELKGTN